MASQNKKGRSVFHYFRIVLVSFSVVVTIAVVLLMVIHQTKNYRDSVEKVREERIAEAMNFVQNMVAIESEYVTRVRDSFDRKKVLSLEQNVQEAHNLATTIYEENRNVMTINQIKRLIIKSIASLNSSSTRQHVSINTIDGVGVYNPNTPRFDGINMLEIKDRTGAYFVKEEIDIVTKRGEGFRYATDTLTRETKVVFVKEFAPLDWYFVSLVYPTDYYGELVSEVASRVSVKFFGYKGDAFVIEDDGKAITTRGKIYDKLEYFNFVTSEDPAARKAFQLMQDSLAKNPSGSFVRYAWYMRDGEGASGKLVATDKISYVKRDLTLGWIIGAGFFVSEIDAEINEQVKNLQGDFYKNLFQIIIVFIFVIVLELFLLRWGEGKVKHDFSAFVAFFKTSSEELDYLDLNQVNLYEFRELGEVANKMILARQQVENKLLDEQKKAKEADLLKSSFLANMSHEIRTPMNAIIGFSNFLTEDLSIEERKEFTTLIRTSGENLLNLIDSIIDFSKIEVGQISLKEEVVRYDKLCSALYAKYNSIIETEGLAIEFKIENALPVHFHSMTDEHRLKQILQHLIDNAFKFTSKGLVSLSVEQKLDRIYFKVTDTGVGISPENQDVVFDRFTQLESTLSRNYGGTGIGLAISAKLVDMLGGKIWVESELGKGSVFQFYIPMIDGI